MYWPTVAGVNSMDFDSGWSHAAGGSARGYTKRVPAHIQIRASLIVCTMLPIQQSYDSVLLIASTVS